MDILKVRRYLLAIIVGIVVLFAIGFVVNHKSDNDLGSLTYANTFSGTKNTYYADKGLEVASTGLSFVNSDALNVMEGSKKDALLIELKNYVSTQSHYQARNPVIADVTKQNNQQWSLRLLIDSSEQQYLVKISFNAQNQPTAIYTEETDAQI